MRSARTARTRFRLAKCRSAAMSSRCGSGSSGRAAQDFKNNKASRPSKRLGGQMANWYGESSPLERRTFWASFGGWALDALDVQMFSLAIPALIAAFAITKAEAGLLGSITLFFGAIGGWIGGALGDRFGRVKALQMTILTFALATFACAFAMSYTQLLALKAIQGLGFGAEWACGAVLMAEIISPEQRGKALGTVQS